MRECKLYISNKSFVALKISLFAALLIGLVVFIANTWSARAVEPLCGDGCPTTTTTLPETDCYDGIDNDGDDLIDCEDPDCNGDYCGDCLDNDCLIDQNPFSFDYLISGTMTCIDSVCSSETCEYGHFCADDDLYDSVTVSCHAVCDEDVDCEDYCGEGNVRYYDGVCDLSSDCTCAYSTEDCDDNDGWYDTGQTRWVDIDQCNEKEQKEQEYQDWYCSENAVVECDRTVTDTRWVDTGKTRNKEDGTPCDDGLWCTVGDQCIGGECIGTERDCSDENECTQDICDEELDQCENPPESYGVECGEFRDCPDDYCDWSFGVFFPDDGHDYCDGYGSCVEYSCDMLDMYCTDDDPYDGIDYLTCGAECDEDVDCEDYCGEGNVRYYDGYCDLEETCGCSWLSSEDCDDYDCSTPEQWECEGGGSKTLREVGDDYSCAGGGCDVTGFKTCNGPWTCDAEYECQVQECGVKTYTCYRSKKGFIWGYPPEMEEICDDGYDNDCDGLIDCDDPDCDQIPPLTEKEYGTPYFGGDGTEWITSSTPITLTAEDQPDTCTVGVKKIYWRNTIVDDEYCWDYDDCLENATGSGTWNEYYGDNVTFYKQEESCHLIEYYSVDNFDNEEEHHKQCVFVDNKPPSPEKEVSEFKLEWDGSDSYFYPEETAHCWDGTENEIECWIVTTDTQISMNCVDQEPHPVGVKELCYRVELDGNDTTEDYCDEPLTDGWCCIDGSTKDLTFLETSEHELEFYCVDELDQESKTEIEKFKVVEIEEFEIQLNFKWNLISVPFVVLNDDPADVFKDIKDDVLLVLTYDAEDPACVANDGWCIYIPKTGVGTIEEIKPGWGYWVLMNESTYLTVVGISFEEGKSLVSRSVVEGWNLIGYYGTEGLTGYYGPVSGGRQAFCALHSLVNEYNEPKWDALITYWNDFIDLDPYCDNLDPGAGYWIGMNVADPDYRYATGCSGNPC